MFLLWPIKLAIRLVELVVLAAIVYLVVTGAQVVEASRLPTDPQAAPHAAAVVVLSAPLATASPAEPGTDLAARLGQAVALFKLGKATRVVVGGPLAAAGAPSVTSVAGRWLAAHGVPTSAQLAVTGSDASAQLRAAGTALGS
ncbi:MAG TPA: hypothetical protein VMD59_12370, partial [Acidimicrobiales bacterium]|nr:hypothetical protein [Acidimicrobiales bacterium]